MWVRTSDGDRNLITEEDYVRPSVWPCDTQVISLESIFRCASWDVHSYRRRHRFGPGDTRCFRTWASAKQWMSLVQFEYIVMTIDFTLAPLVILLLLTRSRCSIDVRPMKMNWTYETVDQRLFAALSRTTNRLAEIFKQRERESDGQTDIQTERREKKSEPSRACARTCEKRTLTREENVCNFFVRFSRFSLYDFFFFFYYK